MNEMGSGPWSHLREKPNVTVSQALLQYVRGSAQLLPLWLQTAR